MLQDAILQVIFTGANSTRQGWRARDVRRPTALCGRGSRRHAGLDSARGSPDEALLRMGRAIDAAR